MPNLIPPDISHYHTVKRNTVTKKTERYYEMIRGVARKHGLPTRTVELILESQFKIVRDTIRAGEFLRIKLMRLGSFLVKHARLVQVMENRGHYDQRKRLGEENVIPDRILRRKTYKNNWKYKDNDNGKS